VDQDVHQTDRFDLNAIARQFPDAAETLLLDRYLTDEPAASTRLFRVYRSTPPHYHAKSNEHLYVLTGRGTFWLGDAANVGEFAPGHLLVFKRGVVHALPDLIEGPIVFLAIDTPRRDPSDVIFVNPADGTPERFIKATAYPTPNLAPGNVISTSVPASTALLIAKLARLASASALVNGKPKPVPPEPQRVEVAS
jgi:mannose-6-phosphate isomerase-like protein (cupin superfamily)